MATISLWMEIEEALIEVGVPRKDWAGYTNKALKDYKARGFFVYPLKMLEVER